jgi:hypothetical protein
VGPKREFWESAGRSGCWSYSKAELLNLFSWAPPWFSRGPTCPASSSSPPATSLLAPRSSSARKPRWSSAKELQQLCFAVAPASRSSSRLSKFPLGPHGVQFLKFAKNLKFWGSLSQPVVCSRCFLQNWQTNPGLFSQTRVLQQLKLAESRPEISRN